ncbi:MAG: hypothetical protein AB7G12_07955 [Thermoanaerobaculia bacterium]
MSDERKVPEDWQATEGSDGTTDDWPVAPAAVYGLEQPLRCPSCEQSIDQIVVVRLFRARVNFMSSLPRSGRLLACPRCRTILPGELGAVF